MGILSNAKFTRAAGSKNIRVPTQYTNFDNIVKIVKCADMLISVGTYDKRNNCNEIIKIQSKYAYKVTRILPIIGIAKLWPTYIGLFPAKSAPPCFSAASCYEYKSVTSTLMNRQNIYEL